MTTLAMLHAKDSAKMGDRKMICRASIFLTCAVLVFLMEGCVLSIPKDNVDFAPVNDMKSFCGKYRNLGVKRSIAGEKSQDFYLSSVWFKLTGKENASISEVEIKILSEDSLQIRAVGQNGVAMEKVIVKDKDFTLEDGKIRVSSEWGVPLPIVGLGRSEIYFGIDQQDNGKYREKAFAVGALALVIPMVISGSEGIVFERIK